MSGTANRRPRLRAVIFDMDGLLVDTEPLSYRAWVAHLARDYGATLTEEDHAAMVGMSALDSWTIARILRPCHPERSDGSTWPSAACPRRSVAALRMTGLPPLSSGGYRLLHPPADCYHPGSCAT